MTHASQAVDVAHPLFFRALPTGDANHAASAEPPEEAGFTF